MKIFVVISLVALVKCRPQNSRSAQEGAVEVEKQQIRLLDSESNTLEPNLTPPTPNIEASKLKQSTREILDKIGEVNRKHGLVTKRIRPAHIQIPTNQRHEYAKQQLPRNPFTNPIFDYINSIPSENKYTIYSTNGKITPDDVIPGQFIKRKVTHQQTIITPIVEANNYGNYFNQIGLQPEHFLSQFKGELRPFKRPTFQIAFPENIKQSLENQTVQNIKNIVNTHYPPPPPYGYLDPQLQVPYYDFYSPYQPYPPSSPSGGNGFSDPQYLQILRPGRQWQSPINQYFPIVIRDPLQQIINAFTSMVEYGEQQNQTCCKSPKTSPDEDANKTNETAKSMKIGDLQIDDNEALFRTVEDDPRSRTDLEESKFFNRFQNKTTNTNRPEDTNTHSKDNTGNGIFIHKLRVRQGGVAIAGPGGVATAGHGGTAIVGPNGYAFTQPDSIAIAGDGAKVVAVNPGINLTSLVENPHFRRDHINARVGRVVAIGPVVYHNTGQ